MIARSNVRRRFRTVGRWLGYFALLVVLLVVGAWALLQTPWAKGRLATFAEHQIGEALEQEVRIVGLGGLLPWSLKVEQLSMRDADGVWLDLHDLSVKLRLRAILARRIHLERITIDTIELNHLPRLPDDEEEADDDPAVDLQIDALIVKRLRLGPEVLGQELAGALNMQLMSTPGQPLSGHARLTSEDGTAQGELAFALSSDKPRQVSLEFRWQEAEPMLSELAGVPELAPLMLEASINGPLDALSIDLQLRHDNAPAAILSGSIHQRDELLAVDLQGRLFPGPFPLPEEVASRWRQPLEFTLKATRTEADHWSVQQLQAVTRGAELQVSGDWSQPDSRGQAAGVLRIEEVQGWQLPLPEEAHGPLELAFDLRREAEWHLDLQATSSQLQYGPWIAHDASASVEVAFDLRREAEWHLDLQATSSQLQYGPWIAHDASASIEVTAEELELPAWPQLPKVDYTVAVRAQRLVGPAELLPEELRELSLDVAGVTQGHSVTANALAMSLAEGRVSGTAEWQTDSNTVGANLAWAIPEVAELRRFAPHEATGELVATTLLAIDLATLTGDLELAATWSEAAYGELPLAELVGRTLQVNTTASRDEAGDIRIGQLQLVAEDKAVSLAGSVVPAPLQADLTFEAAWPDLQQLATLLDIPLAGGWQGTGRLRADQEAAELSVNWQASELRWEEHGVAAISGEWTAAMAAPFSETLSAVVLVGAGSIAGIETTMEQPINEADYSLDVVWSPDQQLAIRQLSLRHGETHAEVTGSVDVDRQTMDLTLVAGTDDVQRFASLTGVEMEGRLQARIDASGEMANPELTVSARAEALTIYDVEVPTATVTTTWVQVDAERWQGVLEASGTALEIPFQLRTGWLAGPRDVSLDGLELIVPDGAMEGNLAYTIEQRALSGELQGVFERLSLIARFLNEPLSGQAGFRLTFAHDEHGQQAVAELQLRDIASEWADAGSLDLRIEGEQLLTAPTLRLSGTGIELQRDQITIAETTFTIAGDADHIDFDIELEGEFGPRSLQLTTVGSIVDQQLLYLRRFAGNVDGTPFSLAEATTISRDAQSLVLQETLLSLGSGQIQANAAYGPDGVDAAVTFREFPLRELLPPDYHATDGIVSGSATLGGTPAAPIASIDVTVTDLTLVDESQLALFSGEGRLTLDYEDERASGSLDLLGERGETLEAKGTLPLEVSLVPFTFNLPDQGRVEVSVRQDMDIGATFIALLPAGHDLIGSLSSRLTITGTLQNPEIAGSLIIRDGRYENHFTGTVLRDLVLHLEGHNDELIIHQLSAGDGGNGSISGRGRWRFARDEDEPIRFNLKVQDFRVIRHADATINAWGDLLLAGDFTELKLSGSAEVSPAEIRLTDLGTRLTEIDVVETRHGVPLEESRVPRPTQPSVSIDAPSSALPTLSFAVSVTSPARVFVRGRGLDSEWRGEVELRGDAAAPRLLGTLSIVRGTFSLAGKRLRLEEGTLRFTGDHPISPSIHLVAVGQSGDVTIRLIFSGMANAPELRVESEPQLPVDEALSLLLFGRGTGQISPLQAIRLAQISENLGAGGDGFDVTERLRNVTGLDVIDLAPAEEEGGLGRLQMGKYVHDRVYLQYGKGLGDTDDRITVEGEITPNLSLESSATSSGNTGLGLNWKFDY